MIRAAILYRSLFVIQIFGGHHSSVHDKLFSMVRGPILYKCLFAFWVVAPVLHQILCTMGTPYVQC